MWRKYEDNKTVCWEKDGLRLTLKGIYNKSSILTGKPIVYQDFEISPVVVEEWKELWVKIEDSSGREVDIISFGDQEEKKPKPNGWYSFTFKNYLGKSYIRVRFENGEEITTGPIEVISSKTTLDENEQNGKLPYCKFLKALIEDLIKYLASSPFDLGSPTEFYAEEYPQPPSIIFILHTLAQNAENIIQALQTIWHNPYRRLATEERWVLLNEVKNVDEDTIIMMLKHPEYLRRYTGSSLPHIADKLKGYVPEKIYERQFIETLDNSENRFIKKFIDIILYWCDELERKNILKEESSHKEKIERLKNYVRYLRVDPLFSDVGHMTIFPASSQVLLKRDGYRECLSIYRLLHLARIPIFNKIQEAIDNRRIDQLYEYWCFFKLSEMLSGEGAKPEFRIKETTEGGLGYETVAELGNGYELVYNRTWEGGKESYSVSLRPDFSLMKDRKLEVVFDAKFRFDVKELIEEGSKKKILEDVEEDAIKEGKFEKIVKIEDIYKMHTYRDALQCRASIVVYPGDRCHCYDVNRGEREVYSLLEVIEKLEGVGFIGLVPGK